MGYRSQTGPLKNPTLMGKQGNLSQLGGDFIFGPGTSPRRSIMTFTYGQHQAIRAASLRECGTLKIVSGPHSLLSLLIYPHTDVEIADLMRIAGVAYP